jgi:hypothetical protein
MGKYSCDKCGKDFTQKSHYDRHMIKKNPCIASSKLEEIINNVIEKKFNSLNAAYLNLINDKDKDNDSDSDSLGESDILDEADFLDEGKEEVKEEVKNTEDVKNTKEIREQGLDKFYTKPNIVDLCLSNIQKTINDLNTFDLVLEPSAGNGSFYNKIIHKNKIGIDLSPENKNIIKQDFFTYKPVSTFKNIAVIGNPPFGKNSSIAIKFFNHAATFSNFIAFIIPKTFRRVSVQNKLNLYFHLVSDIEIPNSPCSFTPPMNVKCCFQIWIRKQNKRNLIILDTTHEDWNFLPFGPLDKNNQPTPPMGADFALRAYGGKCGDIITDNLSKLRPKSWHWIKSNIDKKILIQRFNTLDYSESLNTARQNSIGRGDLVKIYSEKY